MALNTDDISGTRALVIEGNPVMRSVLVAQLRDFGVKSITQCSRIADARSHLEYANFDFVLCELHFPHERITGQDLLNDLRRQQLIPFSTVFVMITGEATYSKVAEAAESALDGYLLKPHKPTQLGERLEQARIRKLSLKDIFQAIEAQDFDTGARLCLERFTTKGPYWLYAARVGAELLLRTGQHDEAKALYEAVIAAKTLPWAKLGVARSMLDAGQTAAAMGTLENLISEDPGYSDAYDVMGRAQFELGRFDQALATYKMACELTPSSIGRLQSLGMMTFYAGDRQEAEKILTRMCLLGLDSVMFDGQSLVLMAFAQFERSDHKALQRTHNDFLRLMEKSPEDARLRRLSAVVDTLSLIQHHKLAAALVAVRSMVTQINEPSFDFESATNLVALLSQLACRAIQLDEVHAVVDALGLRFCTGRAMTELLIGAANAHRYYGERIKSANTHVLKLAEHAMTLSLRGDPTAAVVDLISHGQTTLNSKLADTAHQVLDRHRAKISGHDALTIEVNNLRVRCSGAKARVTLGEQKRQAGGLTLRVGVTKPKSGT